MREKIMMILRGQHKMIDVWHYLIGNYRYKLYYDLWPKWLMRRHIREQIDFRIKVMKQECYDSGCCIKCGCETTMLQMANKACKGKCYPPMMRSVHWYRVLTNHGGIERYISFIKYVQDVHSA